MMVTHWGRTVSAPRVARIWACSAPQCTELGDASLDLKDKLEVLRLEIAKAIATIEAGLNTELVEIEKLFYLKKTPVNRLN